MDKDYLASYKAIHGKLKKYVAAVDVVHPLLTALGCVCRRFLRKPNYPEAADQLHQLQQLLRQENAPSYAAFCALAASRFRSLFQLVRLALFHFAHRCEQAMNNPLLQASTLVKTGIAP
jgi:hypothetical protein